MCVITVMAKSLQKRELRVVLNGLAYLTKWLYIWLSLPYTKKYMYVYQEKKINAFRTLPFPFSSCNLLFVSLQVTA